MNKEYEVAKPEDFKLVIDEILTHHKDSKKESLVLALQGDLGTGKTTFTQVLGQFLGVNEQITSPTFTIMKQYELEGKCFDSLVHIDAYRIESEDEVGPLKLIEVFHRPKTIVCIEWPEQMSSVVPEYAVKINLNIIEKETRKVKVNWPIEK